MVKKAPFLCTLLCNGVVTQRCRTGQGPEAKPELYYPRCSTTQCSQLQLLNINM